MVTANTLCLYNPVAGSGFKYSIATISTRFGIHFGYKVLPDCQTILILKYKTNIR